MRLAIFADIHANRQAFSACLDFARARGAERIVCLGDIVGYGADPEWAVDTVMGLVDDGAIAVIGNHDHAISTPSETMNAVAQAAAIASLDAADELLARCKDIAAERDRVRAALLDQGYEVPPSQANFVWLPLGDRTAAFNEHCLRHKVIVRAFVGDGARVTIGAPYENEAFLAAAVSF